MFFKKDNAKQAEDEKGAGNESRGARDEFEAIALICQEDRMLMQRVLEKVRVQRELAGMSALDLASKQNDGKEQIRRNK